MVMKEFPDEGAVAIDYETFYDTKARYTLGFVKGRGDDPDFPGMSAVSYCRDERFDPYLVSIYGPDISDTLPADENGCQLYVGRPESFDSWRKISHRIVLAHNAGFDEVVTLECVRRGLIPELVDVQWQDTIDLARYLMTPGSLKDSMKHLFGREISKAVRAAMDGRTMSDLSPKELDDLIKYGGDDAKECWEIWHTYAKYWPTKERKISCQLRESIIRGIRIDREYAERALNSLKSYQDSLLADLPWYPQEKPASVRGFKDALMRLGLVPPKSVAKNNPDFMEFMKAHEDVPFIKARLRYAATIPHVRRLEVLLSQLDDQGCSHPGIKYFGAHSGRTSAGNTDADSDGKNVNMLNMTRSAVFKGVPEIMDGEGIDMRGLNIARPGHKFVIFDYSQIEARFSLWLVGDDHMMGALKEEGNLYQANAVAMGWCQSKSDIKHKEPDLYRLAKCCLTSEALVLVRSERRRGGLTNPYYKRIIRVTPTDRVWDGHEWVRHLGVEKMKEVSEDELVEVGAVCVTGDHRVYVGESESRRADSLLGDAQAAAVAWGQSTNPVQGWAHVRVLAAALARACAGVAWLAAREAVCLLVRPLRLRGVRQGGPAAVVEREAREDDQVRVVCPEGRGEAQAAERVGEDA
jgi:hypothetical protein